MRTSTFVLLMGLGGTMLSLAPAEAFADLAFELRETIPNRAGFRYQAGIADLDGDGLWDMIDHSGSGHVSEILEWDGTAWNARHAIGVVLQAAHVADVDGDGTPEIILGDQGGVQVHEATGNDAYAEVLSTWTGQYTVDVSAGDSDGDGLGELYVARGGVPSHTYVFEATADDTYEARGSRSAGKWSVNVIPPEDLDGDGVPELGLSAGDYDWPYDGRNTVLYEDDVMSLRTFEIEAFHFGDTDGNGAMEMIGLPPTTSDLLFVENDGDNSFSEVARVADLYPSLLTVADADGDGRDEVLTVQEGPGGYDNILSILSREGSNLVEVFNSADTFLGWDADVVWAQVLGDTNGNGAYEMLVTQGDRLHFLEVADNVIPEPGAVVVWCLLAVLGIFGWRRRK